MAEKKVNKARIIMKHDTEENWLKATNFIPLDGEIIIYDADATNTIPRMKIGDGITKVNALPFTTEELENNIIDTSDALTAHITDTSNPHKTPYHTPSYSTGTKIGTGSEVKDLYVPEATDKIKGVTVVYPQAQCTTYTSDNGTCTPAAVKKAVGMFVKQGTTDGTISVNGQNIAIPGFISYSVATEYTDSAINSLVNGAPTTLDTLKEIADAMAQNETVVEALDDAIGSKAAASDLTSHINNKNNPHAVTAAQVGLGNVENKSSATIRGELTKANVTDALGYTPPTTNTTYSAGTGISISTANAISNAGVRSIATGTANGTISVNTNGTAANVAVKGLGSAAYTASTAYDAAGAADSALASAKTYADEKVSAIKYAGSSSAGGAATSANKINTDAGSATQPVYFSNGIPVKTTYTLEASVPSSAKFTDTTYSVATTSAAGLMSATDKSKLDGIASGANKTTVDNALSSTSTNPVQNKIVKSAIDTISNLVGDTAVSTQISNAVASKQNTITGAATTITGSNLTANRTLISNGSGKVAVSSVTSTELGYLSGATSSIQTQLNAKVPTSRTINGKALSSNVTLSASDVGADASGAANTALASAKAYTDALNIKNGTAAGSIIAGGASSESSDYVIGNSAFAMGTQTKASGQSSHAEGILSHADGSASHAEGSNTFASGNASHAEGQNTYATAITAHAEGYYTSANGGSSHAEGYYTIASSPDQHVQGRYNINDTAKKYAHIVGNGTSDGESNAHTLDWDGNAWFQGNVLVGGTSQDDTNAKQLATEEYVNNRVPNFTYSTVDLEAGVSPLAEGEVYFVYE